MTPFSLFHSQPFFLSFVPRLLFAFDSLLQIFNIFHIKKYFGAIFLLFIRYQQLAILRAGAQVHFVVIKETYLPTYGQGVESQQWILD